MAVTNADKNLNPLDPRIVLVALFRNEELNMQPVATKLHSFAKWHTKPYDSTYHNRLNVCYDPETGSLFLGENHDPYYLFHIFVSIESGVHNNMVSLDASSHNWTHYMQDALRFPEPYDEPSYKRLVFRSHSSLIAGMGENNHELLRALNSWLGRFVSLIKNDLDRGAETWSQSSLNYTICN